MSEYNRDLDVELFKKAINVGKEKGERFINVKAYQYNDGEKKVRLEVRNKNTNPDAPADKKWIGQKGISSLTKPEVQALIKALEQALTKI